MVIGNEGGMYVLNKKQGGFLGEIALFLYRKNAWKK